MSRATTPYCAGVCVCVCVYVCAGRHRGQQGGGHEGLGEVRRAHEGEGLSPQSPHNTHTLIPFPYLWTLCPLSVRVVGFQRDREKMRQHALGLATPIPIPAKPAPPATTTATTYAPPPPQTPPPVSMWFEDGSYRLVVPVPVARWGEGEDGFYASPLTKWDRAHWQRVGGYWVVTAGEWGKVCVRQTS